MSVRVSVRPFVSQAVSPFDRPSIRSLARPTEAHQQIVKRLGYSEGEFAGHQKCSQKEQQDIAQFFN